MKTILRNIVCLSLLIAASISAQALTIVRTNSANMSNTSIISAADAAAASAAFDYAAAQIMARYNDPIQINITLNVVSGTGTLGGSSTFVLGAYTYSQVKTALIADGVSADDATFNATLPSTDPSGTNHYYVPRAEAKALGLIASDASADGTFTFGAGFSYTYDPNNRAVSGKFDFIGIAFHEITEIMGRIPGLGANFGGATYFPYDLHRFTGSGVRGLTGGAGVYFSIDNGVTNLKNFNNAVANGGDAQDWASGTNDAFNAFSGTGVLNAFTPVDVQVMDVIGYNLIPPCTINLTSLAGTTAQTVCINTPITNITYATTGATGATVSGLPTGVTGVWASNVVTISGTPSVSGVFNYTVTPTPCGSLTATGTITVTPNTVVAPTLTASPLYPMSGQEIQTIYLNYPASAQSITLTASGASGGSGSLSYSWQKNNCASASMANISGATGTAYTWSPTSSDICSPGSGSDNIFSFTVTVKDVYGCVATSVPKKLNVVDPYASGDSIRLCHKSALRGISLTTLMIVPPSQVSTHLAHGDILGNCSMFTGVKSIAPQELEAQEVAIYPNPTTGVFVLELSQIREGAHILITDMAGRTITTKTIAKDAVPTATFDLSTFARGVYMMAITDGDFLYRTRIVIQ